MRASIGSCRARREQTVSAALVLDDEVGEDGESNGRSPPVGAPPSTVAEIAAARSRDRGRRSPASRSPLFAAGTKLRESLTRQ